MVDKKNKQKVSMAERKNITIIGQDRRPPSIFGGSIHTQHSIIWYIRRSDTQLFFTAKMITQEMYVDN